MTTKLQYMRGTGLNQMFWKEKTTTATILALPEINKKKKKNHK